jgi:hypothetical protein
MGLPEDRPGPLGSWPRKYQAFLYVIVVSIVVGEVVGHHYIRAAVVAALGLLGMLIERRRGRT